MAGRLKQYTRRESRSSSVSAKTFSQRAESALCASPFPLASSANSTRQMRPVFLDRVDIAKLHRADGNLVFVCHENRNAVLGRLPHELLLRQGMAVSSCACPLEQKSLVLACVPAQNGIIIRGGFYSQHGNPPLGWFALGWFVLRCAFCCGVVRLFMLQSVYHERKKEKTKC